MLKVRKKQGKIINAYKLGLCYTGIRGFLSAACGVLCKEKRQANAVIRKLIKEKKIIVEGTGRYEVFSQEAVHGVGEIAYSGDYVKIDSTGNPYPNSAEFFQANHKSLGNNQYEQIPQILDAWNAGEEMCEEIQYLINEKGLILDEARPQQYYTAPLWGTLLSQSKDAYVIFYQIRRAPDGSILDADFNFVEHDEFLKTYDIIG